MSALVAVLVVAASLPWWGAAGGRAGRLGGSSTIPTDAGPRSTRRAVGWLPRGSSARSAPREAAPDTALLLELVAAALSAGAPVPRALSTIADELPGDVGAGLRRAAGALALGASWSTAWADVPAAVRAVGDALEPTATTGASPVPLLRSAAAAARRRRRAAGRAAAGRVGVWLVLPLGLCFLPAFLLLGVVPVVLSIAGGLLG